MNSYNGKRRNRQQLIRLAVVVVLLVAAIFAAIVLMSGSINPGPTDPPDPHHSGATPPEGTTVTPLTPITPVATVNVSRDTVVTVLRQRQRAEAYSMKLKIDYFWTGHGSGAQQAALYYNVYVRDGMTKIEQTDQNGNLLRHTLYTADTIYEWTPGGTVYSTANSPTTGDDVLHIPRYEDILTLDESQILEARREELHGREFVFVSFENADIGYRHDYYISTDLNLLERAEVYENGEKAYEMTVLEGPSGSTPDASHFNLP